MAIAQKCIRTSVNNIKKRFKIKHSHLHYNQLFIVNRDVYKDSIFLRLRKSVAILEVNYVVTDSISSSSTQWKTLAASRVCIPYVGLSIIWAFLSHYIQIITVTSRKVGLCILHITFMSCKYLLNFTAHNKTYLKMVYSK